MPKLPAARWTVAIAVGTASLAGAALSLAPWPRPHSEAPITPQPAATAPSVATPGSEPTALAAAPLHITDGSEAGTILSVSAVEIGGAKWNLVATTRDLFLVPPGLYAGLQPGVAAATRLDARAERLSLCFRSAQQVPGQGAGSVACLPVTGEGDIGR